MFDGYAGAVWLWLPADVLLFSSTTEGAVRQSKGFKPPLEAESVNASEGAAPPYGGPT